MGKLKQDQRPLGSSNSWAKTPGTYIAAQAAIDGADHAALTMEQKWGAGRLRLLVHTELREKFDRQRYLLNQAIWHGDLDAVRREAARMVAAWQALNGAAEVAGAQPLAAGVWELVLEDGTVVAIVRDGATPQPDGRRLVTYSLDELANIIAHYRLVTAVKQTIQGATVTAVRRPDDPLDNIRDTLGDLDDPLDDPIPHLGA